MHYLTFSKEKQSCDENAIAEDTIIDVILRQEISICIKDCALA